MTYRVHPFIYCRGHGRRWPVGSAATLHATAWTFATIPHNESNLPSWFEREFFGSAKNLSGFSKTHLRSC
jgi:hypothetical protein